MKGKIINYSIDFVKEMIPVIVGILIALFIDNWNENLKDKQYIEQVYATINDELKETNIELSEKIPIHRALIDSLSFYEADKKVNILDIVLKTKGITLPKIKMSAWKSVSSSKIDLMDYKKVIQLSTIEEDRDILKDQTDHLVHFLYSNLHETDKNKKETLKIILLDVVETEKTIQQLIEQF